MRMKKYEITDIAHPDNPKLHRIRALTDLTEDVLAGMLGGYVESYDNLDQEGRAEQSGLLCQQSVYLASACFSTMILHGFRASFSLLVR